MSTDAQLYEETFSVEKILPKRFDHVDRITANSNDGTTKLTLDVNTDLYPIYNGDNFSLLIASTLNLDGSRDETSGWRPRGQEQTLADLWDYVCHGKVYKVVDPEEGDQIKIYVSFGGLLLELEGPYKKLSPLKIEYVYMLLKK